MTESLGGNHPVLDYSALRSVLLLMQPLISFRAVQFPSLLCIQFVPVIFDGIFQFARFPPNTSTSPIMPPQVMFRNLFYPLGVLFGWNYSNPLTLERVIPDLQVLQPRPPLPFLDKLSKAISRLCYICIQRTQQKNPCRLPHLP